MGSVLVFNDFKVSINHAVIDVDLAVFATFLLRHFSGSSLVELGRNTVHGLLDFLDLGLDGGVVHGVDVNGLAVVILHHLFEFVEVSLYRVNVAVLQLVGRFLEGAPGLVDHLVGHVSQFHLGLAALVFFCKLLGFGDFL